MFDKPRKTNVFKQTESICQIQSTSNQSSSQIITDDDEIINNSNITVPDVNSKENAKNTSSSQIIESESEDLSQFISDVSSLLVLLWIFK